MRIAVWSPNLDHLDKAHSDWETGSSDYFLMKFVAIGGKITKAGELGARLFVAPEFYFIQNWTKADVARNLAEYKKKENEDVRFSVSKPVFEQYVERLRGLSRNFPSMIIAPGTAVWRESEDPKAACKNTCPILVGGDCIHLDKADLGGSGASEHNIMSAPCSNRSTPTSGPRDRLNCFIRELDLENGTRIKVAVSICRDSNPDETGAVVAATTANALGFQARNKKCFEVVSDGIGKSFFNDPVEKTVKELGSPGASFQTIDLDDGKIATFLAELAKPATDTPPKPTGKWVPKSMMERKA
jgi:hypothetical protein